MSLLKDQNIETFREYSVDAVYCLISDELRSIYVTHGNVLKGIIRLLDSFKDGRNKDLERDLPKLELRIIKVCDNELQRKLVVSQQIDYWRSLGYKVYRNRKPLTLTCKTNYRIWNGEYYFFVELISRRYNRTVVGVFETEVEALEFMSKEYPKGNAIVDVVYAGNELTAVYRNPQRVEGA
jgi:hypothetical protein